MRIISHVGRSTFDDAVDAVRDVLDAMEGRRDPNRAWTRGWRGSATILGEDLVLEAGRRNSAGRRRIRISAARGTTPIDSDPATAIERLRTLAGVLVDPAMELVPADDLANANRTLRQRLALELGSSLPYEAWMEALVHPGSSRTPPRVEVLRADGSVVELGDETAGSDWSMPPGVPPLLIDDAMHLLGAEIEADVVLRLGTAAPFVCVAENAYGLLQLQKTVSGSGSS